MKRFFRKNLALLCRRLGETRGVVIDWRDVGNLEAASQILATMRASKWLNPQPEEAPKNQNILVLAPHPDDEIIGPGGTLLKAIAGNCRVKVIVFSTDEIDGVAEEIQDVAKTAGFDVHELKQEIINFSSDIKTYAPVIETIKNFKPTHIFMPFMLDDHPDHMLLSKILLDLYKNEKPSDVTIWAYQVYGCLPLNAVVNIGDVIDRKIALLRLYRSRFKTRDWAHYTRGLNALNVRFLEKSNSEDYAEVFLKTSLKNYLELCRSYFGD